MRAGSHTEEANGITAFPSAQDLTATTNATSSAPLFRYWVEQCTSNHVQCQPSTICNETQSAFSNNWSPARLLDVDTANPEHWRLCVPAAENRSVSRYTTMTYRWGDAKFLKLTLATLKSFQASRPISDLPDAFQDAISVTRSLSIQYLWIDALCILQDNPAGFSHECAEMSNIYTHSACNVITGFGQDLLTSIFSDRDFGHLKPGKFTNTSVDKSSRQQHDIDAVVDERSIISDFDSSPIKSRGWILQEFLLAPRAPYFGRNETHWICSSLEASELWPKGYPCG